MRVRMVRCITDEVFLFTDLCESGSIALLIDLCTRWRGVVGFKPQLLYPQNRRVGGSQTGSGEEKHFLPLPANGPQFLGCPYNSVVTIPTMLSGVNILWIFAMESLMVFGD